MINSKISKTNIQSGYYQLRYEGQPKHSELLSKEDQVHIGGLTFKENNSN